LSLATREDPAEEEVVFWCGDCGREIGQLGYDFPSEFINRCEPEFSTYVKEI